MIRTLTLIGLFSLLTMINTAQGQKVPDADSVTITLQFKDNKSFYYLDDFGNIVFLSGRTRVPLDNPYFELIGNQGKIRYILRTGDHIQIVQNTPYPLVRTDDSVRNLELQFDFEYFKKFEQKSVDLMMHQKALLEKKYVFNPKLRDEVFAQELDEAMDFLKIYQRTHHLSDSFFSLHAAVIDYKLRERRNYFGKAQFTASYRDSLTKSQLTVLANNDFLFLHSYKNLAMGVLGELLAAFGQPSYQNVIHNHFKEKTKHYLIARLLSPSERGSMSMIIDKKQKLELATELFNDSYRSGYQRQIRQMNTSRPIDPRAYQILNNRGEKIDFSALSGGKLTYLDFWASWCLPCREEMPESKKLQKEFAGKDVNFVYISTDRNLAAWQNAMKQISIPEYTSFVLPDVNASAIGRKYKISAIPRYMLMDKNGNVVDQDAPRPSDPRIRQVLNRWISDQKLPR